MRRLTNGRNGRIYDERAVGSRADRGGGVMDELLWTGKMSEITTRDIAEAIGLHIVEVEPVVYTYEREGFPPIICRYAIMDTKGEIRVRAWQTPELAWEHLETGWLYRIEAALELWDYIP